MKKAISADFPLDIPVNPNKGGEMRWDNDSITETNQVFLYRRQKDYGILGICCPWSSGPCTRCKRSPRWDDLGSHLQFKWLSPWGGGYQSLQLYQGRYHLYDKSPSKSGPSKDPKNLGLSYWIGVSSRGDSTVLTIVRRHLINHSTTIGTRDNEQLSL